MQPLWVMDHGPRPGAFNMAEDARLLAEHRPADATVLRLYRWRPPAVSYGYNQRAEDFDRLALAARGLDLVQRPTGGRAILHAEELTYAVVGSSPSALFGHTLHDTYATINQALLLFLARLEIAAEISSGESRQAQRHPLCFQSAGHHEIRVSGRKLVGSAQRRTGGVFLQHGSILAGPAHAELVEVVRTSRRRVPVTTRAQLLAATTDLSQLLGHPLAETDYLELARRLAEACAEAWGLVPRSEARADRGLGGRALP
jgi:lipoate-protein ligase A